MTAAARAVTGLAVREIRRSAAVVVVVVATLSAMIAVQYRLTFADAFDAASLQALAENVAIKTLFGDPVALDDAGGFTVWRTGTFTALMVGVWAILAATRVTRGAEEVGRWDLLLAGQVRLPRLVGRHLAVLVAAQALIAAALMVAMVLARTEMTGSLLYGAAIGLIGMLGAGLGTCAAQLVPDRRTATGLAVAVLLSALLLRMIADGVPALSWLSWLTPFGLLAAVQPYAADRTLPLLVLIAATATLGVATIGVAARRDLGAGLIAGHGDRPPRIRLLRSLPRFAIRRTARGMVGWAVGIGAYFLLIGTLAESATAFLRENPRYAEQASKAGFAELGTVEGFVSALFSLLAVPIGVYAASRIAVAAADENAGRLQLLFALPVGRLHWAAIESGVVVVSGGCLAVLAGAAIWIGATVAGAPLGLGDALAGALNPLPVALVCLGAALFALGWLPQAVLAVGTLPAAGGYLLLVLADSFGWPSRIRGLSPFAHLAAVPSATVNWSGTVALTTVAAILAAVGFVGFQRRDLRR